MEKNLIVTQAECRKMAEDHWRSHLSFAAAGSIELGQACIIRLEERINSMAAKMSDEAAEIFRAQIDEERNLLFDEYVLNPEKFKRRLGISQPPPQPPGCLGIAVLFVVLPILFIVTAHS